jgi:pimeloyl-ACP methyl ester carboxylesterase
LSEPEGFSHQYATINGLRYHFVREPAPRRGPVWARLWESGPPLLIHCCPGFYYEWRLNIEALAQRFDVVVPDMRGYGHSDKPELVNQAVAECISAGHGAP